MTLGKLATRRGASFDPINTSRGATLSTQQRVELAKKKREELLAFKQANPEAVWMSEFRDKRPDLKLEETHRRTIEPDEDLKFAISLNHQKIYERMDGDPSLNPRRQQIEQAIKKNPEGREAWTITHCTVKAEGDVSFEKQPGMAADYFFRSHPSAEREPEIDDHLAATDLFIDNPENQTFITSGQNYFAISPTTYTHDRVGLEGTTPPISPNEYTYHRDYKAWPKDNPYKDYHTGETSPRTRGAMLLKEAAEELDELHHKSWITKHEKEKIVANMPEKHSKTIKPDEDARKVVYESAKKVYSSRNARFFPKDPKKGEHLFLWDRSTGFFTGKKGELTLVSHEYNEGDSIDAPHAAECDLHTHPDGTRYFSYADYGVGADNYIEVKGRSFMLDGRAAGESNPSKFEFWRLGTKGETPPTSPGKKGVYKDPWPEVNPYEVFAPPSNPGSSREA